MKKKKTTKTVELVVERSEFFVSRPRRAAPADCAECGPRARMATPEEAAALSGVTARTIYRWVEAGRVHFAETPEGALLVCLGSLPR